MISLAHALTAAVALSALAGAPYARAERADRNQQIAVSATQAVADQASR